MVQTELEKTLTKETQEKPVRNGKKTSVTTQIANTVDVVDSIIADLRLAQNGNQEENALADQLISSLTEIRSNTLRRNPVVVWQNPQILLKDRSVIKGAEQTQVEAGVPLAKEKSEQLTSSPEDYIDREELCQILEISDPRWQQIKNNYIVRFVKGKAGQKFYNLEDIQAVKLARQQEKEARPELVKKRREERLERLTEEREKQLEVPEGYISFGDFLGILDITDKRWHQVKNRFSAPTRVKIGNKFYYLKTDVDAIKEQGGNRGQKVRKTEQSGVEPTTISEFAAKHNLEIEKILEIARSHFNWEFNNGEGQLSQREQRLLIFYIESNLKTAPEGFMTVAQICKTLGISKATWYTLRFKHKPSSFKTGTGTFYKVQDVDKIAKDRAQKANERMEARTHRKPASEKEFEEMMDGSEELNSKDLDPFSLHLEEIGRIPLETKKHKLWGIKILNGQLAIRVLENLLSSNLLNPSQTQQIKQILETPRAKDFSKELNLKAESKLKTKKSDQTNLANKKFFEVLQKLDLWLNRLKASNMPQVIEHQIKLFNSGSQAFDNLVTSNMRLVVNIAKRYLWSGFPISDLVGYGDEGLMKASVKFDWRLGYQFSTHAMWWIRRSIDRAIADYSATIRAPVHMHGKISKFKKGADELLGKGEDVDMKQLANEADPSGNLVKGLQTRNLVSLNSAVGPDQDSFVEDFLEDVKNNIDDTSDRIGMREVLMEALNTLPHREKRVLMLRYGLEDGRSKSLDHVAAYLVKDGFARVTRERIRQIETQAIGKLKRSSRARKLRTYLDDNPMSIKINPGQAADAPRNPRHPTPGVKQLLTSR